MKKFFAFVFISILIFSCTKKEEETKVVSSNTTSTQGASFKKDLKTITPKDLQAILKSNQGKVVLINFFATWCPPCRKEVPELIELYKTYKNKNVEFIGIAIDDNGAEAVAPFAEKININYP